MCAMQRVKEAMRDVNIILNIYRNCKYVHICILDPILLPNNNNKI